MNRRLIITADDYGMCDAVNDAIEECLAAGAVHATCVMINMPAYAAAAALRQRFPHRSIGIHWNLTQGRPLLPPSQIPSLVNGDDGNFLPASQLRCRWLLRRISPAELTAELRAQYQRFCEVAGEPDFWNTHQNVHVLPGLFETCVALGQALRIPAMRCHRRLTMPRDTTRRRYNLHHPLYWVKGWIIARWSSQAEARGVMMPDARLYMPGYEVSLAAIAEAMKHLPWGAVKRAVEMVIHPATSVQAALFGGLTESRILEYRTFRDPRVIDHLHQMGIKAVGFEVLNRSCELAQ